MCTGQLEINVTRQYFKLMKKSISFGCHKANKTLCTINNINNRLFLFLVGRKRKKNQNISELFCFIRVIPLNRVHVNMCGLRPKRTCSRFSKSYCVMYLLLYTHIYIYTDVLYPEILESLSALDKVWKPVVPVPWVDKKLLFQIMYYIKSTLSVKFADIGGKLTWRIKAHVHWPINLLNRC